MRKFDRRGDRTATGFLGASIGGFHDSRSAAGHDRESCLRDETGGLSGQLVVRVLFGEAGRAEHRHARTDEVKPSESSEELVADPKEPGELESSGLRPLEEAKFWDAVLLPIREGIGGRWRGWVLGRIHPFMLEMDADP